MARWRIAQGVAAVPLGIMSPEAVFTGKLKGVAHRTQMGTGRHATGSITDSRNDRKMMGQKNDAHSQAGNVRMSHAKAQRREAISARLHQFQNSPGE